MIRDASAGALALVEGVCAEWANHRSAILVARAGMGKVPFTEWHSLVTGELNPTVARGRLRRLRGELARDSCSNSITYTA